MSTRSLRRLALFAAAALAFDQIVQFTLIRDGYLFGRRIAPYDPPIFAPSQVAALARIRAHVTVFVHLVISSVEGFVQGHFSS